MEPVNNTADVHKSSTRESKNNTSNHESEGREENKDLSGSFQKSQADGDNVPFTQDELDIIEEQFKKVLFFKKQRYYINLKCASLIFR